MTKFLYKYLISYVLCGLESTDTFCGVESTDSLCGRKLHRFLYKYMSQVHLQFISFHFILTFIFLLSSLSCRMKEMKRFYSLRNHTYLWRIKKQFGDTKFIVFQMMLLLLTCLSHLFWTISSIFVFVLFVTVRTVVRVIFGSFLFNLEFCCIFVEFEPF